MRRHALIGLIMLSCGGWLLAQRYRPRYGGGEGWLPEDAPVRTAREVPTHSTEFPRWTNAKGFERDVFTFARVRYKRNPYAGWSAGYCFTDFPDSDLNFSYRLQQLTSLKVDPDGRVLSLTDPELFNYPWIYMVEPGGLRLEEDEANALRKFLLNGGFLMADDFWGEQQWRNFASEMQRVFPGREFRELEMNHPIFKCVFDLSGKQKNDLQTPNFATGERSQRTGITWEYHNGEECRDVHIRALFDDKDRMMVIACHNTDNGDGWEREQEFQYFFQEFSEKRAYPLGINIIFYAMTH
ncbi:MAG TPA: DUF4159 domain-containing protein [Verrucomicrobiae bacterium]|nr:DUF4159 domain-containing protein [Verrucomicrobiae bacterium]